MAPFLKMGSQFKQLCIWVQDFRSKRGLTTKAFADCLENALLIIESNIHEIRRQHEKKGVSILRAMDALAPLQFLVTNLHSLVSTAVASATSPQEIGIFLVSSMYSIITTHGYDWKQKKHTKYLSILTWMLEKKHEANDAMGFSMVDDPHTMYRQIVYEVCC